MQSADDRVGEVRGCHVFAGLASELTHAIRMDSWWDEGIGVFLAFSDSIEM